MRCSARPVAGGALVRRLCTLIALWLLSAAPGWAQSQRLDRMRQILSQEVPFRAFDKVSLGEAERCPSWLEVEDDEGQAPQCRRLDVVYRNVYLSGFLVEHLQPARTLTIYHAGHESGRQELKALRDGTVDLVRPDGAQMVSQLYRRSSDVLVLFMPGHGLAPAQEAQAVNRVYSIVRNHGAFALLDFSHDSALAYFVAHAKGFLDRFGTGYRRVLLVGRSGGGWASTMTAALDRRIDCSVSFFGSLPMQLRLPMEQDPADDLGDFEQNALLIYRQLDYVDLYALAASRGRRHVLVYNEVDDCCFSGAVKGRLVAPLVAKAYRGIVDVRVEILPWRSAADHFNLDASALRVVEEQCGLIEAE